MKNVLVIGGSGFVGKAVVRPLQKNRGARCRALSRQPVCCRHVYGFRRIRSELDADRARYYLGLGFFFAVVKP
jgi:nucleoside-diphosphate-sugar epimerase